ncbi:MAG TPA: DUF971 domain-containing protein [Nitrospiria bacterium]
MRHTPTLVKKQGGKMLEVVWDDDHVSRYSFRLLRQNCPCAGCVDEWTGRPRITPESIPLDLEGLKVDAVGGYALSFAFSDQHTTGIYQYDYLRGLCPCDLCQPAE